MPERRRAIRMGPIRPPPRESTVGEISKNTCTVCIRCATVLDMARLNLKLDEATSASFQSICEKVERPMAVMARIVLRAFARDVEVQAAIEASELKRLRPESAAVLPRKAGETDEQYAYRVRQAARGGV